MGDVAMWEEVRVTGALDEVRGARRFRFEQCDLRGVSLPASCRELQLIDCVVGTLDLANASLQAFEVSGSSFTGCRLLGATLAGSLDRTILTDCQLTMSTLRMCRLSDVEFHDCAMGEIDLYESVFRTVLFQSCDLTGATLSRSSFTGCEMRDCRLDGLRGVEALGGVRIAFADLVGILPQLARAVGIEVEFDST